MHYLPWRRLYRYRDRLSHSLPDIVKGADCLTVRRDFVFQQRQCKKRRPPQNWPQTLFEEVTVVPFPERYQMLLAKKPFKKLYEMKKGTRRLERSLFADEMNVILERVIERSWRPEKYHVVMCSSGWDSRHLAKLVRRIYERRGDDWLGEMIFLCVKDECQPAAEFLRHIGWEPARLSVLNKSVTRPGEYLRDNLDFEKAWQRLNGIHAFPFSWFYYPVERLQREGKLPDEVQIFSGLWANETSAQLPAAKSLHRFERLWYPNEWSAWAVKGELILPWRSLDLLRLFISTKPTGSGDLRKVAVRRLDPALCSFQRISRGERHWTVSKQLFKDLLGQYKSSWYGRQVAPDVEATDEIVFHPWWSRWSAASFTEHLRREGYQLAT